MIQKLVTIDNPILRVPAEEMKEYDPQLTMDLWHTMKENSGVGLAAPQIGVSKRLVLVQLQSVFPLVLMNPRVFFFSKKTEIGTEACLSLPGVSVEVERPVNVIVDATGEYGPFRIALEGLAARVVQHEIDHLYGLLIDRFIQKGNT